MLNSWIRKGCILVSVLGISYDAYCINWKLLKQADILSMTIRSSKRLDAILPKINSYRFLSMEINEELKVIYKLVESATAGLSAEQFENLGKSYEEAGEKYARNSIMIFILYRKAAELGRRSARNRLNVLHTEIFAEYSDHKREFITVLSSKEKPTRSMSPLAISGKSPVPFSRDAFNLIQRRSTTPAPKSFTLVSSFSTVAVADDIAGRFAVLGSLFDKAKVYYRYRYPIDSHYSRTKISMARELELSILELEKRKLFTLIPSLQDEYDKNLSIITEQYRKDLSEIPVRQYLFAYSIYAGVLRAEY